MSARPALLCLSLAICAVPARAQESKTQESKTLAPRHITLSEAVDLALKHNHLVRLASFKVEEKEQAKNIARSSYFPILHNDTTFHHTTDSQFIEIPTGAFGVVDGTAIPGRPVVLNQGGHTILISGTGLTQPLTELFRVKPANDAAAAELNATRNKARQTENAVALRVHQIYYRVLIGQNHREAALAKIQASESLEAERIEQAKLGATLAIETIESRAQTLEARQDLLTTELQLSDLTLQLNDAIGLPLSMPLELDATVRQPATTCEREECIRAALSSHPEVLEAQAEVQKAEAAVRLSKREYIPNVEAFARYSYQDHVPFLARNFGTFGFHLGYDLFDGGRRNAEIGERKAQMKQAEENLNRVKEEIEVRVQAAYNKLERTRQMVKVADELLALRSESRRVFIQQVQQGAALRSQEKAAAARELEAKTSLLQSQLDFLQAQDEMAEAIGQTPQ